VSRRNVFSDDGTTEPDDTASQAIQAYSHLSSFIVIRLDELCDFLALGF